MALFFLIVLLCLFLGFSAFMSGSETAFFSLPSYTVKSYKYDVDTRKRLIYHLLQNPRELLVTIMMLNMLVNILVQNTVSSIFGDLSGWALKVGLPLVLTLFLGEIIPKSLALPNNAAIAYKVVRPVAFIAKVLGPIRTCLTKATSYISRFMFFFLKKEKELSADELEHALKASRAKGVMNPDEAEIVSGYLDLQDETVKEIMRPREEILFYDIQDPLDKLVHLFTYEECSRVPVCNGDLDNIIGMISTRRYFFYLDRIHTPRDLEKLLKKPFFIPESTKAISLLKQLRAKKESIAMVVDEYGSISGLITQEDLVESVIGEIADRRDIKSRYTRSGQDVIIASGKLELKEIEDIFGIELKSASNVVTIGGWLTEQLADIPQAGMKYVTDDLLFYVLAADPNRVRRVYIRHLHPKKKRNVT